MQERMVLIEALDVERARVEKAREAMESFPVATAPVGSDGGWVWLEDWEAWAERLNTALAALDETDE